MEIENISHSSKNTGNTKRKTERLPKKEWEDCPNCKNEGFTVEQTQQRQYVTREMAIDGGDLQLEGQLYCDNEFEQVQCEFCWTNLKSVFYQKNKLWKNI